MSTEPTSPTPLIAVASDIQEVGRIVYDKFDEGLRFIIKRGPFSWCAYIGITKDHPLAGMGYDDISFIPAHGGLTFAGEGKEESSLSANYYWYGWDYAHAGDVTVYNKQYKIPTAPEDKDWTVDEVIKDSWETLSDFKQLVKLAEKIKNTNS